MAAAQQSHPRGTAMPTVTCPKCNRPVSVRPGGAVFCAGCGTHVSDEPEPPTVQAVEAVDDEEPEERPVRPPRRGGQAGSRGAWPQSGARKLQKRPRAGE